MLGQYFFDFLRYFFKVLVDLSQGFIGHPPVVSDNVGDAQRCLFLFLGQALDRLSTTFVGFRSQI